MSKENFNLNLKATCLKGTYGLSGNDYRVASLPNSYLTPIGQ